MNIIRRYTLQSVTIIYGIALLLFVFALQLVETVTNLIQYIQLAVPAATILKLQLLFLPESLHFALPITMLFAVSFSMGNFYSTRELLALFGAGMSLMRFCTPILLFAAVVSLGSFLLEDWVVVGTRAKYHSLRESVLLINPAADNEFIAVFGGDGNDVYYAEYYDNAAGTLSRPTFIERDSSGFMTRRISALLATWDGESWVLDDAHSYVWNESNTEVQHIAHGRVRLRNLGVPPSAFSTADLDISEMNLRQARRYVASRKERGLPFKQELTNYHKRFAFACTTIVVAFISCGIGSFLHHNTLLLSMLLSLWVAVAYYVVGLLLELLALNGYIAPLLAAWFPVLFFLCGGIFVLKNFSRY